MAELYEALCDMFIRPTRQQYSPYDLGCPLIGSIGRRKDFTITNTRGFKLQCSYYQPTGQTPTQCVIYLHSLNGCRLECIRLPEFFLKEGIAFASLDFTACGNSQGQYVSLGCHQTQDTLEFVEYLHHTFKITTIALWGRSMGAVTAIKFAQMFQAEFCKPIANTPARNKNARWVLASIVVDSPFVNLNKLALQIANKKINIPSFLIKAALMFVKGTIEQKADFKFDELDLNKCITKMNTPVMILASKEDELVSYKHSEEIFNNYAGKEKHLEYIGGNHNEFRSQELLTNVANYIIRRFDILRRKQIAQAHRELSAEDGKMRRLTAIKSSSGNLSITTNKSYTTLSNALNTSSLTPTNKPSSRVNLSSEKNQNQQPKEFRALKHQTSSKKKIDIMSSYSENFISDFQTQTPQHHREHIQIKEQDHFNIIHEKLGNMKKKGFVKVPTSDFKKSTDTPEVKRKHTISLSKSPINNGTSIKDSIIGTAPPKITHSTSMSTDAPPTPTPELKHSISSSHKSGNLLKFTKKPDLGSLSNRKQYGGSQANDLRQHELLQTPTK